MRNAKEGHGHQTKCWRARLATTTGAARPLLTRWGEALDPDSVRSEHPRPQFARDRFTSLNGWWDYAFVPWGSSHRAAARCVRWAHPRALSPESLLSGVGRQLQPDELLWYVRRVPVPALGEGERCLLHFEAVDFACACCVNGQVVGTHEGGYLPFPSTSPRRLRLKCPAAPRTPSGCRGLGGEGRECGDRCRRCRRWSGGGGPARSAKERPTWLRRRRGSSWSPCAFAIRAMRVPSRGASNGSSRAASGTRPKVAFGSRCGWRSFPLVACWPWRCIPTPMPAL